MISAHGLLVVEGGNFLLIINCTQSIKRVQVGKNVKIVKKSEPLVYFFKNASHVVKKNPIRNTCTCTTCVSPRLPDETALICL